MDPPDRTDFSTLLHDALAILHNGEYELFDGGVLMANYIAWYGKKRERLLERERDFLALLQTDTTESKLAEGAEEVRAAQVRAMKAMRAELPPSEKNARAVANLDQEIAFWTALSAGDVIDGYRTGKIKGHRSTAVRQAAN
jgi:hypothetical protein